MLFCFVPPIKMLWIFTCINQTLWARYQMGCDVRYCTEVGYLAAHVWQRAGICIMCLLLTPIRDITMVGKSESQTITVTHLSSSWEGIGGKRVLEILWWASDWRLAIWVCELHVNLECTCFVAISFRRWAIQSYARWKALTSAYCDSSFVSISSSVTDMMVSLRNSKATRVQITNGNMA